jgi:hypothetical protein
MKTMKSRRPDDLVDRSLLLLECIETFPGATMQELADILGWTNDLVRTHARFLVLAGMIEMESVTIGGVSVRVAYPFVEDEQ